MDQAPGGPLGLENWQAANAGSELKHWAEYALFSDAHITGELTNGLGPYKVLNTVAGNQHAPGHPELAMVLRVDMHTFGSMSSFEEGMEMNSGSYHGGGLDEEIAALLSLALGFRCRGGGLTRVWDVGGDRMGRPWDESWKRPWLIAPRRGFRSQLPRVADTVLLTDALPLLERYPRIDCETARVLVRAARMFQQALWYADADAQIAWLLLVGAVEAAAETWTPPSVTALERLRLAWPELEAVLERGDPVVAEQSAKMLAGQVRVTRRFLAFLGTFLPPPPDERPTEAWRLDWGDMEDKLRTIYRHRSKALHAGVPFPLPMCQAPREEPDGGWEELPSGLATHVGDAVWPVASTPMLLHVFAHIVAGALCGWWRTL